MVPLTQTDDFDKQIDAAMRTRPVIEQAKGVLACARRMSPEQAFAELRHVSSRHNVKVNELAAALVATVGGHQDVDLQLRQVIADEWGGLVPQC